MPTAPSRDPRPGTRRVVLHVGAPKSGTTFLQGALWAHRDALLARGVTCPGSREREMFLAAVEVRGSAPRWGFDPEQLRGTWARLCAEARAFDGIAVMSHETLAAANEEQVARALAELEGEEVHVVYTARDLARQVTSEWQERLKNGSTRSFGAYVEELVEQLDEDRLEASFWRAHEVVGVLDRWAAHLSADRVHVVTCPRPGAPPRELWRRFGDACGFETAGLDPTVVRGRSNKTLGAAEASVLRQVNLALDGRVPQPAYARVVKRQFAQRVLAEFSSPAARCPEPLRRRLHALAEQRNEVLTARGYRIYGDLAELLPEAAAGPAPDPDDVDLRQQLDVCLGVIAEMLVQKASASEGRTPAARPAAPPARSLARRVLARLRGRRPGR